MGTPIDHSAHYEFPAANVHNVLARLPRWWERLQPSAVLTPHPGEFSRLTRLNTAEIQADRLALARQSAERWGQTVLLKGAYTVVADAAQAAVNPYANPALATAGTGGERLLLEEENVAFRVPGRPWVRLRPDKLNADGDLALMRSGPAVYFVMIAEETPLVEEPLRALEEHARQHEVGTATGNGGGRQTQRGDHGGGQRRGAERMLHKDWTPREIGLGSRVGP